MELFSLLFLSIAISIDSLLYGMIYEISNIKLRLIVYVMSFLSGYSVLICLGLFGQILTYFFPVSLAKVIGIIILIIFGSIILKDIIAYNRGIIKTDSPNKSGYYQLGTKARYINFSKLIYYPSLVKEKKEFGFLDGLILGLVMNLDGAVISLVLGITGGNIFVISIIFIISCFIAFKIGRVLIKKDYINKINYISIDT
ncbi:hypothetical protein [Orenia marismortui]|uniref:Sporulation protein YtaF n=1 Tax=Orenia marismortui TaxID=46469 RepID=A0A4R8GST4_9FIRM|nr:hypothetical protein [Orenia marismortui]TDX49018.1 hypothetical protein C7959_12232 [Orenia marismortui]